MQWRAELTPAGLGSLLARCGGDKLVPTFGKRCFLAGKSESQRNEGWNSLPCLRGAPRQNFLRARAGSQSGIKVPSGRFESGLGVLVGVGGLSVLVSCLVFVLCDMAAWE